VSTEIVVAPEASSEIVQQRGVSAILPRSTTEAMAIATVFAKSGCYQHKTMETAFAAIMTGAELGLPPAASMRAIYNIDGKMSPSADALVAACLNRPDVCDYIRCVDDGPNGSTWEAKRRGSDKARVISFTLKDAEKAGLLTKAVWQKYGVQMLGSRAKSRLVREVFPDVVLGLYTTDEREEIAEEAAPAKPASVTQRSVNNDVTDGRAPPEGVVEQAHATGKGAPGEVYGTIYIDHLLECPAEDMAAAGRYLAKYGDMSMAKFGAAVRNAFVVMVPYQSTPGALADLWARALRCTCARGKPQWEEFIQAYDKRVIELTPVTAAEVAT
jgi:hypothetical protein